MAIATSHFPDFFPEVASVTFPVFASAACPCSLFVYVDSCARFTASRYFKKLISPPWTRVGAAGQQQAGAVHS